jgi:hypothetical protein
MPQVPPPFAPPGPVPPGYVPLPPPPPVNLSLFGSWWPPLKTPSPVAAAGAVATGVLAGAAVPWDRPGLGWLLAALAATAAVGAAGFAARRTPLTTVSAADRAARVAWTGVALGLMVLGTLRGAGWFFLLCLPVAAVAGSLAVAGGRSLRAMVIGAVAVPMAALRGLPWLFRSTSAGGGQGRTRLVLSALIGVLLVAVFGALLSSADAKFAELVGGLLPSLAPSSVVRFVLFFVLGTLGTAGACYVRLRPPAVKEGGTAGGRRTVRPLEWLLPVLLVDLLFAAFVVVQIRFLFGGSTIVLSDGDLTYAEYARQGFWQLLVVTMLTLVVIAVAAHKAPRESASDRLLLRLGVGALAALTLVIVASALYRMWTYEQAYGFTRLRVLVSACELWLGVVFALILVAGVRLRARWMPRAVAFAAAAALLGLGILNPDKFIAEQNVARWQETQKIDVCYLSTLSVDAVPALDRLPEPQRSQALSPIADELSDLGRDPWAGWNLGRSQAREILDRDPATVIFDCWR